MLRVTYPFPAAGRIAVLPFAVAGFIGGAFASRAIGGAPPLIINGPIWALATGLAAYLVYASQGHPRPASAVQAASADGVVAGVVAPTTCTLLDIVLASGAGGTGNGAAPSGFGIVLALIFAAIVGGVLGGIIGLGIGAFGGAALHRLPPAGRKGKARAVSRNRSRRR